MTLLMPYISRLPFIARVRLLFTAVLVLVFLQGCSSIENTEKQTPEDLDTISKDIVDMVDVPTNEKHLTSDTTTLNSSRNKQNLYVEQAQQRLANVPAKILKEYQQALALMKTKQWQAADKLFDQILLSQPLLSGAYVNKALIALHQNDVSLADAQLNKALAVNAINPYAHQLKGRIARLNGQFAQAEKSYLEALTIWPEYPEAQLNLAILLELYRGRLLDARQYYQAYLSLQPEDKQVQRWLAGIDIKIKRAGLSIPIQADSDLSPKAQHDTSGAG